MKGIKPKKCNTETEKKLFKECVGHIKNYNLDEFCKAVDENPEILTKYNDDGQKETLLHFIFRRQLHDDPRIVAILGKNPSLFFYKRKNFSPHSYATIYEWLINEIKNQGWKNWEYLISLLKLICTKIPEAIDEDDNQLTLLRATLEGNHEDFALELLEKFREKINLERVFSDNKNYLHIAAEFGLGRVASKLIELGLEIDAYTERPSGYGNYTNVRTALYIASQRGHAEVVDILATAGASLTLSQGGAFWSAKNPLHAALRKAKRNRSNKDKTNFEKTALTLIQHGIDIKAWANRRNSKTKTYEKQAHPLHLAAELGFLELIKSIYQKNPLLIEEKDNQNQTPLVYAVEHNQYDAVVVFYAYGANFEIKIDRDFSDSKWTSDIKSINLAHLSIREGHANILGFLLARKKHDLRDLLKFAVQHGKNKEEIIEKICESNQKTSELSNFEISTLLLEGDDCEAILIKRLGYFAENSLDETGNTLLHLAAQKMRLKLMARLLEYKDLKIEYNALGFLPSMLLPEIPTDEENKKIVGTLIEREIETTAAAVKLVTRERWSENLDVKYKSKKPEKETTIVRGNTIHRVLSSNQTYIDSNYNPPISYDTQSRSDVSKTKTNYVTASLTFVVSDGPYEKGKSKRKTLQVAIDTNLIGGIEISCNSIDDKEIKRNLYLSEVATKDAAPDTVLKILETEATWFRHSEQLLFALLARNNVVNNIAEQLKKEVGENHKLYAIVLDYHTTKYSCGRCISTTYAFHHAHNLKLPFGFAHALTSLLGVNYKPKSGIRMLTRVSARDPYGTSRKTQSEHKTKLFNLNTPESTILMRDSKICAPDDYNQAPDAAHPLSLANSKMSFFISGSSQPTKKRPAGLLDSELEDTAKRRKIDTSAMQLDSDPTEPSRRLSP